MRFGAAFWINRTDWPDLRDACLAAETCRLGLALDRRSPARRRGRPGRRQDRGLGDAVGARRPDGAASASACSSAANTFRNPGLTAKLATTVDHLSDGRARPRPRRRLVRARARRLRHRLRVRASASGSTGSTRRSGSSAGCSTARRVTHDGPLLLDARRAVRSPPRPAAAADPHRRLRADQDAPHDRPLRRPVERLRPAREDRRRRARSCASAAPRSGRPFDEIERTVTVDVRRPRRAGAPHARPGTETARDPRHRGPHLGPTASTAA